MISIFRNFARSKWAVGLLALMALSLLITGGSQMDVLGALQPPRVVAAGDRSLDAQEFGQAIEQIRYNIQRERGEAPTTEELANDPGFVAAFQQRAQQLALLAWTHTVGIRPGKDLILREIREQPAFFDPVSRKFDEQAYRARLAEARMTPAMIEEQVRDEWALLHYGTAISGGVRLPRVYGAVIANQTQQRRDGRWFTVTQAMAGSAPAPTDAQLSAFMQQNAAQLRRPELRRGSIIVFDNPADAQAQISDAEIQERFEFRRPALAVAERRTFTTITAPSQAVADRVAAALRAGQAPSAVASANQLQPATYTDTPRTAVGDAAVAGAVFGLAAGQVSDPVRAGVGFVVAKVDSVTPGRDVTLADVRPQILEELRESAARAKALERVNAYEAARRQGQSADDAVRSVGARFIALPPLTREGRAPNGQQVNLPPAMLETIWRLPRGGVSEIAQLADNQVYAVRVDEITPAAMPQLAEIRPALAQAWTQRENARLLSARAEALAARLRRGEDIAAVAQSVGAALTARQGVGQDEEALRQLGQPVIRGLFGTQRGQVFSEAGETGYVIGRVDAVTAPNAVLAADEAVNWRQQMVQPTGQSFLQSAVEAAARRLKATFNEDLARRALGLEPRTATPTQTPAPAGAQGPARS